LEPVEQEVECWLGLHFRVMVGAHRMMGMVLAGDRQMMEMAPAEAHRTMVMFLAVVHRMVQTRAAGDRQKGATKTTTKLTNRRSVYSKPTTEQ
jgi:hypothetical protein